jgi:4-amino-4-deoxychorismate lyase
LHNERLQRTQRQYLCQSNEIDLAQWINVPSAFRQGLVKCRVLYDKTITDIQFAAYQPRPVKNLQLVEHPTIDYTFKFENRTLLNELFKQRGDCDDIMIVKNGFITDSYYANLVFDDGFSLYTPNQPLLKGIRRAQLLGTKRIQTAIIRPCDLDSFQKVHLINAMLNLGDVVIERPHFFPKHLHQGFQ